MDIDRFRVRPDDRRAIKRHAPDFNGHFKDKDAAVDHVWKGLQRLEELQELLYAHDRYSLLLIFQGMDAAGKDHVIKHVMSGVDPQGVQVHSFKQPSAEELDHDFLWRTTKALPERGRIGIFNRSYYEEVLVVRVHPDAARHPEASGEMPHAAHLGRAVRGHQGLRAPSLEKRDDHPQVLPERVAGGAAPAVSGEDRRPGEELEVLER